MLATRIIPVVLMRGSQAVKGERFASWRNVGNVAMTVKVHDMRGVDELVLLEIGGSLPSMSLVRALAGHCFFPLAVGGGVRSSGDAQLLLANGADKIVVGTAACERPAILGEIAAKIGSQSLLLSIDVKDGEVWSHSGTKRTGMDPVDWAKQAEAEGAGEILINDIDRDGVMEGYNLPLTKAVSEAVSVPVVACGGAGIYRDLDHALRSGAHAVAAGAMWQFTEATPRGAAEYLAERGWPTRLDTKKRPTISVGLREVSNVTGAA